MKRLNVQLIYLTSAMLIIFYSDMSNAGESWEKFVVPQSTQLRFEASYDQKQWYKSTWRSGSNFNLNAGVEIEKSPFNGVEAKAYAHTNPQRKSVNPWRVNRYEMRKQYKFGPMLRPWGSVPATFQKKPYFGQAYQAPRLNRNIFPPVPVFNPYIHKGFGGASNVLLPAGGYMSVNPALMYRPDFSLFMPAYKHANAYQWR